MHFTRSIGFVAKFLAVSLACAKSWGQNDTHRIEFDIEGSLKISITGRFQLEGDIVGAKSPLNGTLTGRYNDKSRPKIDPNYDPVAAREFGFNGAEGEAVFTFELDGEPIGTVTTSYESRVDSTNLEAKEIAVVSAGTIVAGTGMFAGIIGDLDSSATVSPTAGTVFVSAKLIISEWPNLPPPPAVVDSDCPSAGSMPVWARPRRAIGANRRGHGFRRVAGVFRCRR